MLLSKIFAEQEMDLWDEEDDYESFSDHIDLKERLRKTFYFGKTPTMDRPSLPMTELAVEYFHEAVPRELGKVDMYWASSVTRKASVSPCAMMLGMLYIERLRHKNPDYLEKMSSEELFLISMMVASKYLYDEGVTEEVYNDEWAESANLDLEDLNELERDFLSEMDWSLYVSEEEFLQTLMKMEYRVALHQENQRGYFCYSDLVALMQNDKMATATWDAVSDICKVLAVCSFAYAAGSLTLAGSSATLTFIKSEIQNPEPFLLDFLPLAFITHRCSLHFSAPRPHDATQTLNSNRPGTDDTLLKVKEEASMTSGESFDDNNSSPGITNLKNSSLHVADSTASRLKSSLSQFLTFTLFKDTLMAFVVGMKKVESRVNVDGSEDDIDRPNSPTDIATDQDLTNAHVCCCPGCPKATFVASRFCCVNNSRCNAYTKKCPTHPSFLPRSTGASDIDSCSCVQHSYVNGVMRHGCHGERLTRPSAVPKSCSQLWRQNLGMMGNPQMHTHPSLGAHPWPIPA